MRDNDVTVVAIVCLTVLECVAMLTHTDGAFFMPIASLVSGLAGYKLGRRSVT